MLLTLTRLLVPVLDPFVLGVLCVFMAFFFLLMRWRRTAVALLACGLFVFLFFGYGCFSRERLFELEHVYPQFRIQDVQPEIISQIRFVVVLGSSHVTADDIPVTAQIGGGSLYRLVEGIRIHRMLPQTRLIFTGGVNVDPVPNAEVVGQVAGILGIGSDEMILEKRPRDTFEEAALLQPVLGKRFFVLVTSAAHMERAVQLFRDRGMRPVPAPTDYILKAKSGVATGDYLPSCGNLAISKRILYEWLGLIWGTLKRWLA